MKKRILKAALLSIAAVGIGASNASALQLGMDYTFDNITPIHIVDDNVAPDLSGTLGSIAIVDFNVPDAFNGGSWNVNATGVNMKTVGASTTEELDLNTITLSSGTAGELWVLLSEIDMDSPGWQASVGGTTDGQVQFYLFVDSGNQYWSDMTALPFATGGVLGNNSDNFAFSQDFSMGGLGGDYSLILGARVTHTGPGNTSFNFGASEVPEPATMLLLGTGLAGIAGVARRKKG